MAFRSIGSTHLTRFNSAASCDFLDMYESFVDSKIREELQTPSSRTFAPSSFRCDRRSWFRLRGVEPDRQKSVDRVLNFTAELGTACHAVIQTNLKQALKDDWISVKDYLLENPPESRYILTESEDGLETKIEFLDLPVRFACDGIIRWKGELYLLEIKTSEFSSFQDLTDPKSIHIDQILCYGTLLGLSNVLVLYQDRQYGSLKCYELKISEGDKDTIRKRFKHVLDMVEANIAPDRLPTGDSWCNNCPYPQKCKEWG